MHNRCPIDAQFKDIQLCDSWSALWCFCPPVPNAHAILHAQRIAKELVSIVNNWINKATVHKKITKFADIVYHKITMLVFKIVSTILVCNILWINKVCILICVLILSKISQASLIKGGLHGYQTGQLRACLYDPAKPGQYVFILPSQKLA